LNILLGLLLTANITLGSPVNYKISLAGNFGEPRPNHFHGGIDIKTDGVEGKPIFSMGDGYISHVSVGIGGYGNALYIHLPEGYTCVYCHLQKFTPQITAMVRKWQYANHTSTGDIHFRPTDLPVAKGQLVALSGNTGSSQAPHLHLEIHDTRTWNMLDPLEFIQNEVTDKMPPVAHGFMAYPKPGEGVFCGTSTKLSFPFTSHNLNRIFSAWGKVGFGIWANDYMAITYNRYGVRRTELYVDNYLTFCSDVNDIPVNDNMMMNAWGDYEHYLQYQVWYLKSFVQPGLTLPFLYSDAQHGYINFNEQRDYHITYVLTDFRGNVNKYTFTVKGHRYAIPHKNEIHPLRALRWDRMNNYQLPGMQLIVRPNSLADMVELSPEVKFQPNKLSDAYRFMSTSFPLFNYAQISLRLKKKVKDVSKLYIVNHWNIDKYMGGDYQDGWVVGRARELGAYYEIAYDDVAPIINPIGQGAWNTRHEICIGIVDEGCGIAKYEGFIDNRFVLFENVPKSPWVKCVLSQTPIKRTGKEHILKFVVKDFRNNTRTYVAPFKY
jgi:murein DD-endopeptidase MepM/ murein hydrolase activator NlpD